MAAATLPPERFFTGDQLALARALVDGDLAAVRALAPRTDLRSPGAEGTPLAHYALHTALARDAVHLACFGALGAADPGALHVPHAELGTALQACLATPHPEFLAALLDAGLDPDVRVEGSPAILVAARDGRGAQVGLLADRGAHLEARDEVGATALVAAVTASQVDVVEQLLARGADARTRDDFGVSFMFMLAVVMEDEGEDSPDHPRLAAVRDRFVWEGAAWPPLTPAAERARMRAEGMEPREPPGDGGPPPR
ncbi:MAG: ankyrin repeat domain-containing protein [Polyangiales bacterium]